MKRLFVVVSVGWALLFGVLVFGGVQLVSRGGGRLQGRSLAG